LKTHLFEWHCVSFSALAVFSRNALYKSTFYLLTYCAAHVQQLNCCVIKKHQTFLCPTYGLESPNSPDLSPVDYEIWAVMQHRVYHRQIHMWMNWNGDSSMSGTVINSWFLTRLLTSGEEDIERVSMLKQEISSTACELTMLILSISVTSVWLVWLQRYISVTMKRKLRNNIDVIDYFCYIFNYEIIPATLANTLLFIFSCSDLKYGGRFYGILCRS